MRVHRSAIVNIESILHLEPISHGEFDVVLKDASRTKVGRTYRSELEKVGPVALVSGRSQLLLGLLQKRKTVAKDLWSVYGASRSDSIGRQVPCGSASRTNSDDREKMDHGIAE